jgi:hypothetical protein
VALNLDEVRIMVASRWITGVHQTWRTSAQWLWDSNSSLPQLRRHGKGITAWRTHEERRPPRWWPLGHVAGKWVRWLSNTVPQVHPRGRSFHPPWLSTSHRHELRRLVWIVVRRSLAATGSLNQWSDSGYSTMGAPFSAPDRASWRAPFSNFHVTAP